LRELTDAELDIVGGGAMRKQPTPSEDCGGGIKLAERIIVDILKILESNGCNSGPQKARTA
jgi:hypothetical protein